MPSTCPRNIFLRELSVDVQVTTRSKLVLPNTDWFEMTESTATCRIHQCRGEYIACRRKAPTHNHLRQRYHVPRRWCYPQCTLKVFRHASHVLCYSWSICEIIITATSRTCTAYTMVSCQSLPSVHPSARQCSLITVLA